MKTQEKSLLGAGQALVIAIFAALGILRLIAGDGSNAVLLLIAAAMQALSLWARVKAAAGVSLIARLAGLVGLVLIAMRTLDRFQTSPTWSSLAVGGIAVLISGVSVALLAMNQPPTPVRTFGTAAVLSYLTGVFIDDVTLTEMDELLVFLDSSYDGSGARAKPINDLRRAAFRQQYPAFANAVPVESSTQVDVKTWLADWERRVGKTVALSPLVSPSQNSEGRG